MIEQNNKGLPSKKKRRFNMVSEKFYQKLMEISKVMEKEGEGISYIHNGINKYTIGTKVYSEKIAEYLDKTVENWEGSEALVEKPKKGKVNKKARKVGYLWKIPIEA